MAFELFANSAQTTLNVGGGINNSVTSITVTSSTGFPASGNFRIIIDSEIMLVTAVSGTAWTVTRGVEGTAAASHGNGAPITHIVTAASLVLAGTLSGTFASRPVAGIAGRKYYATDTPFWYLDNGSSWQKFFGAFPIVTPDDSAFSWDNQASSVITTTQDMVNLLPGSATSFRYKAAPSTPYQIDAIILPNWNPRTTPQIHFGFRESSSGKLAVLEATLISGIYELNSTKYNTSSSFDAFYVQNNGIVPQGPLFLRIEDDGTNRNLYTSSDGVYFALYHSIGRTDFLTANQVCWGGFNNGDGASSNSLIHWQQH